MRRLLVADHDPHIGRAILIRFEHHGVGAPGADGAPICHAPLHSVFDVPTNIRKDVQPELKPPRIANVCHLRPDHRASGDGATSSGGAASVNRGRLPGVAGRRYTPQLE